MKHDDPYNDPLNELLRKHLLEKNTGAGDTSLLEKLTRQAMNTQPEVVMSDEKKRLLLSRLGEALPPPPGPAPLSPWIKFGIPGAISVVLVSLIAFFLIPGTPETVLTDNSLKPGMETHPENSNDLPAEHELVTVSDPEQQTTSDPGPDKQQRDPVSKIKLDSTIQGVPIIVKAPVESPSDLIPSVVQLMDMTADKGIPVYLKPNEDKVFITPNRTLFYFPANCFSDWKGNSVSGMVELRIRDFYSPGEFIRDHIHTRLDGNALQTAGGYKLTATSNGKPLRVAKGMAYYVEFANRTDQEFDLYNGIRNPDGSLTLSFDRNAGQVIVPLPLSKINFLQFLSPDRSNREWDQVIISLNDPRYEGTFVATREFITRLSLARRFGFSTEVVKTYLDNLNLPLYKIDELVAYHLRGKFDQFQWQSPSEFGKEDFLILAKQKLIAPVARGSFNIDLNQEGARMILQRQGNSIEDIESAFLCRNLEKYLLDEINLPVIVDKNSAPKGTFETLKNGKSTTTVWGSGNLQWIPKNRSRGFQTLALGEVVLAGEGSLSPERENLIVSLPPGFSNENTRIFAVINGKLPAISEAELSGSSEFRFNDIPRGASGKIWVLSLKDGFLYTVSGKFDATIRNLNLGPQKTALNELFASLEKAR